MQMAPPDHILYKTFILIIFFTNEELKNNNDYYRDTINLCNKRITNIFRPILPIHYRTQ